MFGIGSTELIVILLVALIVLGPKNLAGISRTLGRIMGEFRRVSTDFQRTLNAEAAADDQREKEEQRKKEVAASQTPQTAAMPEAKARTMTDASVQEGQPVTANAQAGADEVHLTQADQGNKQNQTAGAKPSDQAEISEDGGMELAPPPDSPLARALAQTSAEAARAESVIAETASQEVAGHPESDRERSADAGQVNSDSTDKTDAMTGGKTGASA